MDGFDCGDGCLGTQPQCVVVCGWCNMYVKVLLAVWGWESQVFLPLTLTMDALYSVFSFFLSRRNKQDFSSSNPLAAYCPFNQDCKKECLVKSLVQRETDKQCLLPPAPLFSSLVGAFLYLTFWKGPGWSCEVVCCFKQPYSPLLLPIWDPFHFVPFWMMCCDPLLFLSMCPCAVFFHFTFFSPLVTKLCLAKSIL